MGLVTFNVTPNRGSVLQMIKICGWGFVASLLMLGSFGCVSRASAPPEAREFRPPVSAVVRGVVLAPDRTPVHDARVALSIHAKDHGSGECTYEFTGRMADQVWTDGSGEFEKEWSAGRSPAFSGCLKVEVFPPDDSGLRSKSIQDIPITIGREQDSGRKVEMEILLEKRS